MPRPYDRDVLGNVTSETLTAGDITVQTQSIYNLAGELVASVGFVGLIAATAYAHGGTIHCD